MVMWPSLLSPKGDARIDLWIAPPGAIREASLLACYARLLSADEQARWQRFHFESDRHRYLVTRALVRTNLSAYAPVSPEAWQFTQNSHGRPRIDAPGAAWADLDFNVSHTDDLVVCAVVRGRTVGVDVETIDRRELEFEQLASRFFSARESADLLRLPASGRRERFLEVWTLKEAYVKARGLGLSLPLDGFSYAFPGTTSLTLNVHPPGDGAGSWSLWLFRPSASHVLAMCASASTEDHRDPRCFNVVPLLGHERLGCHPIRWGSSGVRTEASLYPTTERRYSTSTPGGLGSS